MRSPLCSPARAAGVPGIAFSFRKTDAPQAPTKGRSLDHIGFEVKDLEAFCKKLAADGVTFDSPFRDVPAIGLKIAFIDVPHQERETGVVSIRRWRLVKFCARAFGQLVAFRRRIAA